MSDSDFTVLPVYNGVSLYHFNRFRLLFQLERNRPEVLAARFVMNFPIYFSSPHTATVEQRQETSDGKPTLKFLGFSFIPYIKEEINFNYVHHDWVRQERVQLSRGFLAQTLKRNFWDIQDDVGSGVGGGVAGAGTAALAARLTLPKNMTWPAAAAGGVVGAFAGAFYNSMHFLAGRRSWTIGNAKELGIGDGSLGFIETAAVERFSAVPYIIGDWVLKLEKQIPGIWATNLTQFVRGAGLTPYLPDLNSRDPGWDRRGIVDFYQNNKLADLGALNSLKEFRAAAPIHPNLLPPH